jgi:hypothetical protein
MTKETTITFRVESALRDSFNKAAELAHHPASQVLRELMRNYIKQVHNQKTISFEERERRDEAIRFARACVELEGFKMTAVDDAKAQRFINGEIELDEYLKITDGPL